MIGTYIAEYFKSIVELFVEMASYILLEMTIAGVLYVIISKGFVARHIGGHSFSAVFKAAADYAYIEFVDSIALRFVVCVLIAGLITIVIPDSYFAGSRLASGFPGMLMMIAIGTD